MTIDGQKILITQVQYDQNRNIRPYYSASDPVKFSNNDKAEQSIDGEKRIMHAKLHSAGHLIAQTLEKMIGIPGVKGHHNPEAGYIEFADKIDADKHDALLTNLDQNLQETIKRNLKITVYKLSADEARHRNIDFIDAVLDQGNLRLSKIEGFTPIA